MTHDSHYQYLSLHYMNGFLTPPICEHVINITAKSHCYKSFIIIIFTGLQTKSDASVHQILLIIG
jgi:hypothetical protein